MEERKTSEAQLKANRKWESKNKEKTKVDSYRRTAKMFIRTHASEEDLIELKNMIEEKLENEKAEC